MPGEGRLHGEKPHRPGRQQEAGKKIVRLIGAAVSEALSHVQLGALQGAQVFDFALQRFTKRRASGCRRLDRCRKLRGIQLPGQCQKLPAIPAASPDKGRKAQKAPKRRLVAPVDGVQRLIVRERPCPVLSTGLQPTQVLGEKHLIGLRKEIISKCRKAEGLKGHIQQKLQCPQNGTPGNCLVGLEEKTVLSLQFFDLRSAVDLQAEIVHRLALHEAVCGQKRLQLRQIGKDALFPQRLPQKGSAPAHRFASSSSSPASEKRAATKSCASA